MAKIILDLCGGTGAWSKPWAEAGYDVRVITLPDYDVKNWVINNGCLIFQGNNGAVNQRIKLSDIYGILAAPPCTMFSMARTTAKTPRDFDGAMEIVSACLNVIWTARAHGGLKFWAMENPTAYLRQFIGKPVMKFQPYHFGDRYKKSTDLWGYFNRQFEILSGQQEFTGFW